jgi:hypothetical protein
MWRTRAVEAEGVDPAESLEGVDEWEALALSEQIRQCVQYLRSKHFYCPWCGTAYTGAEDLASCCPGEEEDSH